MQAKAPPKHFKLEITKTPDGPTTARAGQTLAWTITVTNTGDATATDVQLTDSFSWVKGEPVGKPTGPPCEPWAFVAGNPASWRIQCDLGVIEPGVHITVHVLTKARVDEMMGTTLLLSVRSCRRRWSRRGAPAMRGTVRSSAAGAGRDDGERRPARGRDLSA